MRPSFFVLHCNAADVAVHAIWSISLAGHLIPFLRHPQAHVHEVGAHKIADMLAALSRVQTKHSHEYLLRAQPLAREMLNAGAQQVLVVDDWKA